MPECYSTIGHGSSRPFASRYNQWFHRDILTDLAMRLDRVEAQLAATSEQTSTLSAGLTRSHEAVAQELLSDLEQTGILLSPLDRDRAMRKILTAFDRISTL